MADLQNSVTRPLIIVFIQLFSAYRQSATLELLVRIKLSLNHITAQKMTNLQNTDTRLWLSYHVSNILEFLQ